MCAAFIAPFLCTAHRVDQPCSSLTPRMMVTCTSNYTQPHPPSPLPPSPHFPLPSLPPSLSSSLHPRPPQQAGLEGIYKELRSLRDLVATAAQAATEPSRRVPVVGSAPPTSRRLPSGVRIKHSSVYIATPPSSSTVLRLPPLDTTSFSPIAPSRKVYTKV